MITRSKNSIVYVVGDDRPMEVLEPDQMRDGSDRARHRMIRLQPVAGGEAHWYRSDMVTGDGTVQVSRRGLSPADFALMRAVVKWCREEVRGFPRVDRSGSINGKRATGYLNWRLVTWAEYAERREVAVELAFAGEDYGNGDFAPMQYRMGWSGGDGTHFAWVEPKNVTEGIDTLAALGFLPVRFSSAYRAGWDARHEAASVACRDGIGSPGPDSPEVRALEPAVQA